MNCMTMIRPNLLAAKLQAARNREPQAIKFAEQLAKEPRLLETLWFVQDMSRRPGSLERFVKQLVEAFPDRFAEKGNKKEGHSSARHYLPELLHNWCEEKDVYYSERSYLVCTNPWYCPDLLAVLSDFMDRHAAETAREIAETEVSRIVFRELEFARSQKIATPIVGSSRFGKTKAVSVWCAMRPGLARLVTVPQSNRDRDFFTAHADAFGLEYTDTITMGALQRKVEFVHRNSGLCLVYDEAHFLIPVDYHKATPPRRLNWVRCQVIDRDCGCAFFATPQTYGETLDAYVAKTGYNMEQWLGRMAPTVILPKSMAPADVLAVARIHFPDVPEPYLKKISGHAMTSEGYLKSMEMTVKRARFLAWERGHSAPTLADVQDAIADMMPATLPREVIATAAATPAAPARQRGRQSAPLLQPARNATATPLRAMPDAEFSRRNLSLKVSELEPALAG